MIERKQYIDIAKGLMILMVVYSHLELMCRVCYHVESPLINSFWELSYLWYISYMPAFFFITGYCSTFSVSFKIFLKKSVKTILIPAFILHYSIEIIQMLEYAPSLIWMIKTLILTMVLKITGEWFLTSLFLARILYWVLFKFLKNYKMRILVALILFVLGTICYNIENIEDIWFFKHVFLVIIFMTIGDVSKGVILSKKQRMIGAILYVIGLIIIGSSALEMPYITNRCNITFSTMFIVLIMAFLGIITILSFSRLIEKNNIVSKCLAYCGRQSLVIYLIHFAMYQIFLKLYMPIWGENTQNQLIYILLSLLSVYVSSFCAAILLNTKYLKVILGKF